METLSKQERLCGRLRISAVFQDGSHAVAGPVMAKALRRDSGSTGSLGNTNESRSADVHTSRVAVVAGKKLAKSAVVRNRMRRRLRAAYRQEKHDVPAGWDIVLVARRGLVGEPWPDVIRSVKNAIRRATAS